LGKPLGAILDFHHLKVFLAAAGCLNYTHAGEELRLRQSTVSAHIKQLEAELGLKLFEHVGKRLALTEAGRLLEPVARRAVQGIAEVQSAADEYKGFARGSVHLGASTTTGLYILPWLLTQFHALYPNIYVRTTLSNTSTIERMVLDAEVDFGFVGGHLITGKLISHQWLEDHIVLITAPDHRLAATRRISVGSLRTETLIQREDGSATRAILESELERAGCRFDHIIELGHPEAIKEAVMHGLGIAFISRFAVERETRSGDLVVVPVNGVAPRRNLQICYRPKKHLSKADTALISEAQQMIRYYGSDKVRQI
jgi:DNA-binding transcriptional LysR family regulator